MILWTIQSPQAWTELQDKGVLRAKRQYIMERTWLSAYQWMAEKMRLHIGPPPESDCLPIWTWYQWEGQRRKKPDLWASGHLGKGERGVRVEFEHPDGGALLSDFCLWHYVLSYWYLPASEADSEAFEAELAAHGLSFFDQKPLPHSGYHSKIVRSWDRIFDLDWSEPDVSEPMEEKSIQAAIWEVKRDQVKSHKHFTSR
jgi:hypothetical protein